MQKTISHNEYPGVLVEKKELEDWLRQNGASHPDYQQKFVKNNLLRDQIAQYEVEHNIHED